MPLISKIEELKLFAAPANLGTIEETFLPCLAHVEETYLLPELGRIQYETLLTAYENSVRDVNQVALSAKYAALLKECRKVLAPLGMLHYKNSTLSQISDAGSVEKATDSGYAVRLWVTNLQNDTLFQEGMRALDNLLDFLERKKFDYPLWMEGEGFSEYSSFLLRTTKQFNNEVNIGMSRRLFKSLRPEIKFAEEMIVKEHIGEDLYERLLDGLHEEYDSAGSDSDDTDELSADEEKLLKMIYPVVANYAIARSTLPLVFGNDGVYVRWSESQYSGKTMHKNAPDAGAMAEAKAQKANTGRIYLDKLIKYLNANASESKFPEFYNSDLYVEPDTGEATDPNDSLDNIFVA